MLRNEYVSRLQECNALNIIFQLTDKCVLSCRYCFAKGTHNGKPITFPTDVLEQAIMQAFKTNHDYVIFEWTGGEPLLVGKMFFERVVELQRKYATKPYENGVQTSGNLLDTELIDFLIENQFSISTTIDGTRTIHNQNRPTNLDEGSYDAAIKTMNYIRDKGAPCGFISTITKNNLGHEKEMLECFQELDMNTFHSNPYIYYEKNKVKDNSIALSKEDVARYFISEFNAWVERGKVSPIPRTIYDIIKCLQSNSPIHNTICTYGGRCLTNFVALTPNGDAYMCPKFTGSDNMVLGNILNEPISNLLSKHSSKMSELIDQRVEAINKCMEKQCGYFYICNGGCPYHSFIASDGQNVSELDHLCESKQMIFDYLKDVLMPE
ncbi:MAG: radical SAM protein [Alistipes sp.]|nr:radical SAM protein [Alistipes sp.]